MAELPTKEELFSPEVSGLESLSLMEDWYDVTTQLPGAMPATTLIIEDDTISPVSAFHFVDTEGQAPQDDLFVIRTASTNNGMFLFLQAVPDRIITIKESQNENGLELQGDNQKVLPSDYPLLFRRSNSKWIEVGKEVIPIVDAVEAGRFPALTGGIGSIPVISKNSEGNKSLSFIDAKSLFSPYELCEFYFFRSPTLRTGFQPAQGGLLENAAELYPEAWAYLQTTEGQQLCKIEAEWQALTLSTWHTLADGTQIGWNGIGGAPFYAPNFDTGALRLPDLRGMYAEAAGFDALGVGDVHGWGLPPIRGGVGGVRAAPPFVMDGAFFSSGLEVSIFGGQGTNLQGVGMDTSRVLPSAVRVQVPAWGALACVYLGAPR